MLEQTLPTPIEHSDQLTEPDVLVNASDAIGYDMESVRAKQEAWQNDGECPGPDEIGRIELSDEALQHLKDNLPARYLLAEGDERRLISEDDNIASEAAAKQHLSQPIDSRSKQILNVIMTKFEEIVKRDSIASNNPILDTQSDSYLHYSMFFGNGYAANDKAHIDDAGDYPTGDPGSIRYLATISGPTTSFCVGDGLGRDRFDEEGALTGEVPDSVTPQSCEAGQVVRFLDRGDPHFAPTSTDPVFRIFLVGSVRVA